VALLTIASALDRHFGHAPSRRSLRVLGRVLGHRRRYRARREPPIGSGRVTDTEIGTRARLPSRRGRLTAYLLLTASKICRDYVLRHLPDVVTLGPAGAILR
jgi:hypothetical protein